MYVHFMVPVDDTALSTVNAEAAVRLASQLGARITFFHAAHDFGGTREGARLKVQHPQQFAESAFGDAHALLSNFAAGAEAAGVVYDTVTQVCERPADAIVAVARARGCDLIVMASRGESGVASWLHGSQTERVLRHSPIPLLVTRVASVEPLHASEQVLASLHQEHQAILAVALALEDWVQQAPAQGAALDLLTLESMLHYLQTYALRVHHPKEEQFLYASLLRRAPDSQTMLADVTAQHGRAQDELNLVLTHLQAVMSEGGGDAELLYRSVLALTRHVYKMVAFEEARVVPLARQHLQEDDWDGLRTPYRRHPVAASGGDDLVQETMTRRVFTRMSDLHLGVARHDQA